MAINTDKKTFNDRPVDLIIKQSEKKMGALALIERSQVKLWKALFISFFFAGFVGAAALTYGAKLGVETSAQMRKMEFGNEIGEERNIAPLMNLRASSFAMQNKGWDKLVDSGSGQVDELLMARTGGTPWVEFSLPKEGSQLFAGIEIINDSNAAYEKCALKNFNLKASNDGKTFYDIANDSINKGEYSHKIMFNQGSGIKANAFRLFLNSNNGDQNWLCLKEVKIFQ